MLDKTNFRIMVELCRDGRASNAQLAQKLNLSVSTVAKRLEAIIREGIVAIKALPNPAKMGYEAGAIIGLNAAPKKLDSVCAQLKDDPHVNLLVTTFGRFDIIMMVYFKEWHILHNYIDEVLPKIKGVNQIETFLVAAAKKRYQGIFCGGIIAHEKPVELDETDQRLIKELIKDGRPSYAGLADKLDISRSTVSRRISSLIQEEIIKIIAIPNPSKLGYSANALVALRGNPGMVEDICDQLSNYNEIHIVLRLMNGFDILFGINSPTNTTLYEFIKNELSTIDGIQNSESFILGDLLYFSADAVFLPTGSDSRA